MNMTNNTPMVYQFKIALASIKPQIWRRIQVPENYSFFEFHNAIQDAMGWKNYHLHDFKVKNPRTGRKDTIGIPNEDDGLFGIKRVSSEEAKIAEYFSTPKARGTYMYDFGDGWQHTIVLESIVVRKPEMTYPVCLAGKRACPPEDCGGSSGYEELLEIISNPNHKEYAERMEWLNDTYGEEFKPDDFDPESVSFFSNMFF